MSMNAARRLDVASFHLIDKSVDKSIIYATDVACFYIHVTNGQSLCFSIKHQILTFLLCKISLWHFTPFLFYDTIFLETLNKDIHANNLHRGIEFFSRLWKASKNCFGLAFEVSLLERWFCWIDMHSWSKLSAIVDRD